MPAAGTSFRNAERRCYILRMEGGVPHDANGGHQSWKTSFCTHVGITNGERGSRRICKRDTKELVRASLVDTNEGPIVEFDFWVLRLGGNSRRFEATGIVRFESKAGVLHGDLYGERVDWRGKREEGTRGKQGQGDTFE